VPILLLLTTLTFAITTASASEPPAPPAAPAAATSGAFDPWRGMDRDGRIPAVNRPAELAHPERWRYIPEGRIKPGNILDRFLISSFIAPFFFRDTDVGLGGGIALTDIDFRQQRRREFAGIFLSHTQEGQQAYTAVWRRWLHHREMPGGGVLQEERSFLRAAAGYRRTLTRRFFGFGSGTDGLDLALPNPGDDIVLGLGLRGEWHNLGPGRVKDVPTTGQRFNAPFREAADSALGWLETSLRWDTRDSQRLPYRGHTIGLTIAAAPLHRGGSPGAIFGMNASKLFPLPPLLHNGGDAGEEHPPTDSLAVNFDTAATAGNLPFYALPSLGGGHSGRGFIEGRFRDRDAWSATVEYRFWVVPRGFALSPWTPALRVERLGMALFYDVGAVAGQWWDLFRVAPRHSGGIGFRATLERSAPFRIDVGFSGEGPQINAGFGLSF
jgi:Omp85 superfamily domain